MDTFTTPIKLVLRSRQHSPNLVPGLQKPRHTRLAAGTVSRLKYHVTHRWTALPTFTPSTAGLLWQIVEHCEDNQ
jgi:hypothetical protein